MLDTKQVNQVIRGASVVPLSLPSLAPEGRMALSAYKTCAAGHKRLNNNNGAYPRKGGVGA